MRKAIQGAIGGAALALAAPAVAQQDPPSEPAPDILVTGERDLERQVEAFVGPLTPAPANGQIGRFEFAVCPVAIGFLPSQKSAVEQRMRTIAEAAGIRTEKPGCTANTLVIVTADKRAFIEGLRTRHQLLSGLSKAEYRRLLEARGPTAMWHLEGELDADGVPLMTDFGSGTPLNRTTRGASRITAQSRLHFRAAALVVEAGALNGLTTTQVADYAAMRLFARTDPSRLPPGSPETILTAVEAPMGSAVPLTLTRWDLGFLRGLYGAKEALFAPAQRGEIGRRLTEDLEDPEPGG